ncbi:MAG: hypothetical protein LBH98_10215 [Chitinispirillales bacterium]|jgi:hypothetical protein|nr:hypothetical protein [Chitinispirillales bacterium]
MKRIIFKNYIKQLPSNTVIEYLREEITPKILTDEVYEKISENFCTQNKISCIVDKLSNVEKNELIQIYLFGNLGKKASTNLIKTEILKTFLVFEGAKESKSLLFGFPDLSEIIAKIFEKEIIRQEQSSGSPLLFSGAFFNDSAIILDMIQNGEAKICANGAYSQRFTDLMKERCGIGKLLDDYDDLCRIIEFFINIFKSFGAEISRENGKIDLLSNGNELLERITQSAKENISQILCFSQTIDFLFLKMLASNSNPVKFSGVLADITAEIDFSLKIFHWCGLVEYFDDNSFKFREQSVTTHHQNGHILPDFNVYIPIEANPQHLYKLLYSVKITDVDVVYKGKIDKKRVEESLADGVSDCEIIEILRYWNAPVSLQETISEWISSFRRAFCDLPYIAFRNDIAQNIAEYSDLKEKITPVEGYTFFKVKPGEEKSVVETLEKFGFDLRKSKERETRLIPKNEKKEDNFVEFNSNPLLSVFELPKKPAKYSGLMTAFQPENRTLLNYAVVMEKNIKIEYLDLGTISVKTYKILEVANGFIIVEDREDAEKKIPFSVIKKIGIEE